jgi:predicted nucleic acid-binding protein
MSLLRACSLAAISTLFLCSCESRELTLKKEQQAIEITRLKGELNLIEEKLRNLPVDKSTELAAAEIEAEAQKEEVKELEAEVTALEAKKRDLEKQFEDYKRKYAVR